MSTFQNSEKGKWEASFGARKLPDSVSAFQVELKLRFQYRYAPCASEAHLDDGADYTKATWRVRDTLEQIDISKLLINKYRDTFELVTSSQGIWDAFNKGKIASLIGLEGCAIFEVYAIESRWSLTN